MPLTEKERTDLADYRADVTRRLVAHQRAAAKATRIVEAALHHIEQQNYGLAKDWLRDLVDNGLPNDHGGPVEHYPLFERCLEESQS